MKTTLALLLLIGMLSCDQKSDQKKGEHIPSEKKKLNQVDAVKETEKFEMIDVDELNQKLATKDEALSAQEVMKMYYPAEVETGEGNEKIEITDVRAENGHVIVTLIHDNVMDDSVHGFKFVMDLKKADNTWIVVSLKKNWRCRSGRGHADWGIELCG